MDVRLFFVCDHSVTEKDMEYWLRKYVGDIRHATQSGVQVVEEPDEATHIVFLEIGDYRQRGLWFRNPLANHPLLRRFPEKCYIWSYEDHPFTWLPGLYASMPKEFFDSRLHRAFRYFHTNAERLAIPEEKKRDILYNFVGGRTSPIRRGIYDLPRRPDALIEEKLTYNAVRWADDGTVRGYVDIMARSQFTLCPKGSATSSYRLFESLRAGSVPVIISDELVLPEGPDWARCSIRVAESDIASIPSRLETVQDVDAMRDAALKAYANFFSMERMLDHLARELTILGPANQSLARRHYVRQQARVLRRRILRRILKFRAKS